MSARETPAAGVQHVAGALHRGRHELLLRASSQLSAGRGWFGGGGGVGWGDGGGWGIQLKGKFGGVWRRGGRWELGPQRSTRKGVQKRYVLSLANIS